MRRRPTPHGAEQDDKLALNEENNALSDDNNALSDDNNALNDDDNALNEDNNALTKKTGALTARLIEVATSQDDLAAIRPGPRLQTTASRLLATARRLRTTARRLLATTRGAAQIRARIERLEELMEICDAKALLHSARQLAVRDAGQSLKTYRIVRHGAADFCASGGSVFGPCCLTSSVCLTCGMPACVRRALDAETPSADVSEAERAIRDGAALPFACHKLSASRKSVPVHCVTGRALEAFFVSRARSGLSWLRSTNFTKKIVTIGEYAPHGFASSSSVPDGVWCISEGLVPLAIMELKDTALDPFDAYGKAVAEGSNCVMRQLNCGLSWDQCRVLFVCCNGSKYLFGFVALLEPHFIHAGPLSPVLDVALPVAMAEAARLLVVIRQACLEQQQLLQARRPAVEADVFRLSVERYHLKPAEHVLLQHAERSYAAGWCRFLHIHDKIFSCAAIREHVVFPLGFSNDADGDLEGVLFPRLDSTWSIGLPDDEKILELLISSMSLFAS